MCMLSEFGGMPSADDGGVRCCGVDDAGGAVARTSEPRGAGAPRSWALGIVSAGGVRDGATAAVGGSSAAKECARTSDGG